MFESLLTLILNTVTLPLRIIQHFRKPKDEWLTEEDTVLFKDNATLKQYATAYATYPSIRTYYLPHSHVDKLKAIADLPLLVFIHGIGGSLAQFAPLLGSFVNIAPTFGIELPGHGFSDFAPRNYEAYSFEAIVDLWKVAIEDVCTQQGHSKIVLICHSLGCSIGAKLTRELSVDGMIAICPKAMPPNQSQTRTFRRLLSLPDFLLDVLRWYDRLGGEASASVKRFVGQAAGTDLKRLQLRFNKQFATPVWKRISLGLLPHYRNEIPVGGLPGREVWEEMHVPLLLIAGDADTVTKPSEAANIVEFIQGHTVVNGSQQLPIASNNTQGHADRASDEAYGTQPLTKSTHSRHSTVVKFVTLPSPASHALMYDHATYRTVAGLIENFLSHHVSDQLELGWQLQQLTTSGKWDVKNLEKWKKVTAVSGPVDGGLFRALKTLREQDEEHTPSVFLKKWGKEIYAIIDISHDSPVYDTKTLERGGIQYHKFPTVSKIPPTLIEVQDFIALVDRLRKEIDENSHDKKPAIAVHCHYGYNRTGFFIVCYLVERRGYRLQDAIEEFGRHKPPGIRHDHFIDTLFVRYCVGLRRASTSK